MNKFDKNNAEIGERIKEVRLKRGMTQEMLSEKAGVCNPQQQYRKRFVGYVYCKV